MRDRIFFNKTSMLFMFESSMMLIIWKIVIEIIIKTTKITIKTIEEKFALNENNNNWKNIFNIVALSIEARTIRTTINESITNRWNFDSNWRSNSNANARNFLSIDESQNATTLSLFIFWTRDLRSRLTISLRKKTKIFMSWLNRKFVMFKKNVNK